MKTVKKSLCFFLSLVMIFSCFGSAVATAADSNDHLPQIYVNGIGSRAVYLRDDPEKRSLFYPIDMDRFLGNLKKFDEYAIESIKKLDPRLLYNCTYSWLWETFGMAALDTDGFTSVEDVVIDPCNLSYKGNGLYHFNYDSRLGPIDLAHQLNEYIGWVQEHSGSQRVELVGSSYGTAIVMAYLNEYKECRQYVDSVVLCVPSCGGIDFVGQLFGGDFTIDADTLTDFAEIMLGNEELNLFLSVLNKSGALKTIISGFLDPALRVAFLEAVRDIVHDVIGTFPSMWSFVQPEYFYDAVEYIYGEDYADPEHEYAVHIGKIMHYNDDIVARADELFKEFEQSGIKMNIIAKYGRPCIPLSEHGNFMSDGVVDLADASFGATCSMYGETLPAGYEQALYPEYDFLSADGCVDASTGSLPFNTWYIRGLEHSEKPDAYYKLINAIAYDDLDVFSDSAYPQFLQFDASSGQLVPLTAVEKEQETSLLSDFLRLLIRLLKLILEKLTEIILK